ncbi:bifunctional proline dehydrogenase/L-glutamate gamma-semialdehyde dehydrogenase [Herbiconiux sp. L3-i23]|uniref:bifunctional proline dehydrogenase/L-glutamate gamma-semialdehyde dehydrogenase n=1 Tax=Herbiconiux sp. L3-i23 TaxID=2905871 RepID=UPI002063678B|nr:bifunctional proline dehydrogenase/L-glutamate gamma-semialdehyde dehydrogenase [Herbiconiux sp. L3-i23]BDI21301.1 proline dehydrogenase [Herbiconiux sp. L3-i23]
MREAAEAGRVPDELAEEAVATVRRWLGEIGGEPLDPAAERLAGVLKDPDGLDFTLGFVDGVVRPEDVRVAGRNFYRLGDRVPGFLPAWLRAAVKVGSLVAPVLPWVVVPIARRVLRGMVSHLLVDARPERLGAGIAALRTDGVRLNLNLLGEAVLGEGESEHRFEGTKRLLERDDVDYVSIKVSSVAPGLSMWAFDDEVARVVERLLPLYRFAASSPNPKFINLDMEEYRDLDLTLAVFTRLLETPGLERLEAGVVLQAYLPDAFPALRRVQEWAAARVARGGAPVKVRVVKGANLAMERVDAAIHGWPLATWPSKVETDAAYLRMLDWALAPERTAAVRIGIAGHNLFDLAWAWALAGRRGVTGDVDIEMLLGMAAGGASAVRREVGHVLLYTPVVDPAEFDVAIAYLVRRLEENASDENFMSVAFELGDSPEAFERERLRFVDALELAAADVVSTNRVQDRRADPRRDSAAGFENEPDTDPSTAGNREWGGGIRRRALSSELGLETLRAARLADSDDLDAVVDRLADAADEWAERPARERAAVLDRAADALARARADLIEVAMTETGKTIAEGDPEVSEAIDFARYYAELARGLEGIDGAQARPVRVTAVIPPWNFPISIPAGGVLAALAAGSGVLFKPAPEARRTGAVVADALWSAGVPRDLLAFVDLDEQELGRQLIEHPRVDQVLLTGSWDTAALFHSWRPSLRLFAETSGKNAIVVTPSADLDLAAADAVRSAFGHAGQKCSAASLVILVGSVGRSRRFLDQLVDAAASLRVGVPEVATTQMGPLVNPASGKLLHALTTLSQGESWLLEPRRLDAEGRIWSPGIRDRVAADSEFHRTEYFGPVLGIMRAATLEQAIELQNAVPYGLTAGLHSLDAAEIAEWLESVEAGNLYLNRGITGAIVARQPFGGWKRSSVGGGGKAGGPNALLRLLDWESDPVQPGKDIALSGIGERVAALIDAATGDLPYEGFEFVRAAARSDEKAWNEEFGVARELAHLGVERNVFRYRPARVVLRLASDGSASELIRLLAAGTRVRAGMTVSTDRALSETLSGLLERRGVSVTVEADQAFLDRLRAGDFAGERIRLVGGDPVLVHDALRDDPDAVVYSGEVTASGRIETLPFLLEQAISMTAHRFGNPDHLTDGLV